MADYSKLYLTAADYRMVLSIPGGGKYPLLTAELSNTNATRSVEQMYAIGEEDAVGIKGNERKYSGKLTMQLGELSAMLQLEGLKDATFISNATLGFSALVGGFARVYSGVYITTEGIDVKAKDKSTPVSLDWEARAMK